MAKLTALRLPLAGVAAVVLALTGCAPAPGPPEQPHPRPAAAAQAEPEPEPELGPRIRLSHDCHAPGWESQAQINESSLEAMPWSPFGRLETGWRVYAPLIAREIGVACAPGTSGFARALSAWQKKHGLGGDGLLSQITFVQMKGVLQERRPIVLLSKSGVCATPADERSLVTLRPEEGLGGKLIQLRPGAAKAYRRMVADARAEEPALARDPELMKIFSGYRSPAYDEARCAAQNNCNGRERASCSPHRTGLAFDLYLGTAAGYPADSSADENRLAMTRGPAYRWMLLNAPRYGFVNYPFEPWHWEWTGEPPQ